MSRFSAKLLFQFRIVSAGVANKQRLCEERIALFDADDAKTGLKLAKRYGKKVQHRFKNDSGDDVHFEFIGVLDLLHLGVECDENEVWYGLKEMVEPDKRRSQIIPPEDKLNAIDNELRAMGKR